MADLKFRQRGCWGNDVNFCWKVEFPFTSRGVWQKVWEDIIWRKSPNTPPCLAEKHFLCLQLMEIPLISYFWLSVVFLLSFFFSTLSCSVWLEENQNENMINLITNTFFYRKKCLLFRPDEVGKLMYWQHEDTYMPSHACICFKSLLRKLCTVATLILIPNVIIILILLTIIIITDKMTKWCCWQTRQKTFQAETLQRFLRLIFTLAINLSSL